MWILEWLHWAVDYLMSLVKLAQNREVGWLSYNRKTGQIEREQQPLLKKLKLLLLFNPITEWIDTTHAMRLHTHDESVDAGRREGKPSSKRQIKGFVDAYHINMNDFEPSDIDAYDSFESFFVRHHTPESRPIYEEADPTKAVVVADSRVVTYESVPKLRKLWVKGQNFSMAELTMDMELGDHFADSAVASFRLSPQDYHRYHSPVSGKIKLFRSIPGDYYQVDPVALRSDVDILTRNHREFVVIESEEFGDVLFVAIGATDVGTVQIHNQWQRPGVKISKGEELGIFQFGGSSIIVAFDQDRIQFDQDLIDMSNQEVQVSVEMGMSLGKSRKLKA